MTSAEESSFSGLFICQYNYEDDSECCIAAVPLPTQFSIIIIYTADYTDVFLHTDLSLALNQVSN